MILTFKVDNREKVIDCLNQMIEHYDNNVPDAIKVFMVQSLSYQIIQNHECVVLLNYKILFQPLPEAFFYWALKRSLRKKGYEGIFKKASPEQKLWEVLENYEEA